MDAVIQSGQRRGLAGVGWRRRGRWLGAAAVLAAATAELMLGLSNGQSPAGYDLTLFAAGVGFALVGAFIIARTAAIRVGWALALTGISLLGSGIFPSSNGSGAGLAPPGTSPVVVGASSAAWYATFAGIGMLMAWFPTGTTPGFRWRWLSPLGVGSTSLILVFSLLSERVCMRADGNACLSWASNPIGIRGVPDIEHDGSFVLLLGAGFVLVAAISLIVRFVRSVGVERLQLKWFAAAAGLFAVFLVVSILVAALQFSIPESVGNVGFGLMMLAIPVAVGIAITRYRLYEIDRIIARTVSYTLVATVVAGIYAIPVVTLPRLLGESSDLVIAGSTLAAAAAFTPVRRRVKLAVDHRFNRTRYDADREIQTFSDQLRSRLTPESIDTALAHVVARTVQPAESALWVRDDWA